MDLTDVEALEVAEIHEVFKAVEGIGLFLIKNIYCTSLDLILFDFC